LGPVRSDRIAGKEIYLKCGIAAFNNKRSIRVEERIFYVLMFGNDSFGKRKLFSSNGLKTYPSFINISNNIYSDVCRVNDNLLDRAICVLKILQRWFGVCAVAGSIRMMWITYV